MTDSRWTYDNGSHEDDTVKAFVVGRNAIAAYSGRAHLGELGIAALAQGLGRTKSMERLTDHARNLLFGACVEAGSDLESLVFLLGVSNQAGATWLFRFDGRDELRPREVPDFEVVGSRVANNYIRQRLRHLVGHNVSLMDSKPLPLGIGDWGSGISGVVAELGQLQLDDSVGGHISCLTTQDGRVQGQGTTEKRMESGVLKVREISVGSEGKTVLSRWQSAMSLPDD